MVAERMAAAIRGAPAVATLVPARLQTLHELPRRMIAGPVKVTAAG
jgi:hypothetical protein